ncbi:MAG: hypothetical protein WBR15_06995 [Gammaproteobacteria bacterium]
MNKRIIRNMCFLAATLLIIILLMILSPLRYYPGVTVDKMKVELNSNLPVGTPKDKVIAFLDNHHIERSEYSMNDHDIGAIIRNTCWSGLLECDIEMKFTFDSNGMLVRTTVAEGLTGL